MKKILITGANSYIGTSFEKYLNEKYAGEYQIDTVDMIDGTWRERSFSGYDAVFHVAGIAHRKETAENTHLYFEVNRDLAIEAAQKSKNDGVRQFIFLSTVSVYGKNTGIITKDTIPSPKNSYGKSKLQAENEIMRLQDECFKACILRPPMVYGKDCKGNFQSVVKIVKKSPVFPKIKNKRSLIYIDNLCEFVRFCVESNQSGILYPHDDQYMETQVMARSIAKSINKRIYFSILLGACVWVGRPFLTILKKAFGNLVYVDCELPEGFENPVPQSEALKKSI